MVCRERENENLRAPEAPLQLTSHWRLRLNHRNLGVGEGDTVQYSSYYIRIIEVLSLLREL